jgi:hypothetical protein
MLPLGLFKLGCQGDHGLFKLGRQGERSISRPTPSLNTHGLFENLKRDSDDEANDDDLVITKAITREEKIAQAIAHESPHLNVVVTEGRDKDGVHVRFIKDKIDNYVAEEEKLLRGRVRLQTLWASSADRFHPCTALLRPTSALPMR